MGPFDRFNDRAKRVLALAQDEATRFNHTYIGTEHLLIGLVREGESAAARVLLSLGAELGKLRSTVEFIIGRGHEATTPGWTGRARRRMQPTPDDTSLFRVTHLPIGSGMKRRLVDVTLISWLHCGKQASGQRNASAQSRSRDSRLRPERHGGNQ